MEADAEIAQAVAAASIPRGFLLPRGPSSAFQRSYSLLGISRFPPVIPF